MKIDAYPEIEVTDKTLVLGYENDSPETTNIYKASEITSFGTVTLYTGDGSLPTGTSRKVNLNTGKLFFYEGTTIFGSDDPVDIPAIEDIPIYIHGNDYYGIVVSNAINAGFLYAPNLTGGDAFKSIGSPTQSVRGFVSEIEGDGFGIHLKAPSNSIFDNNVTPDPALEASSILTISSTRKGTIPFPKMTTTQRDAISSPAIGLMVYVTDGTEGIYVRKSTGWVFVA